ncbi:hypothetical protein LOZ66_004744 [Ophidiomyces ophidiicola]|nr:hypothetical protein LOZ66_004744 [Ophidiomyces ophidiicola]
MSATTGIWISAICTTYPYFLQCDQGEPSCGQCIRANHKCPGYRDQLDLLFRDETSKVARKAREAPQHANPSRFQYPIRSKAQAPSAVKEEELTCRKPPLRSTKDPLLYNSSPFFSRPLSLELKHQALCFFVARYAPPSKLIRHSSSSYPPLAKNTTDNNETLLVCMTAVGLASLSNITKTKAMRLAAGEQYSHALALLSRRLQNPVYAKSLATLDSVMLLGLFEVITCRGPQSLQSWRSHMQGATALLKLSDKDTSREPGSLRTFVQVRGQIISGCLAAETYAPPSVAAPLTLDRSSVTPSEIVIESLTALLTKLANLRASIKEGVISCPSKVLQMTLSLRDDLISFQESVESRYVFQKVKNKDGESAFLPADFVYGDHFHVFSNFLCVGLWNGYRAGRITLSTTISKTFRELEKSGASIPDEVREQYERDQLDIDPIAREICSSLPFALGMVCWESDTVSLNPAGASALGGFLLLWPLYLAAEASPTTPGLQEWIVKRFEYIGHMLGINQALWMAQLIKEKASLDKEIALEPSSPQNCELVLGELSTRM